MTRILPAYQRLIDEDQARFHPADPADYRHSICMPVSHYEDCPRCKGVGRLRIGHTDAWRWCPECDGTKQIEVTTGYVCVGCTYCGALPDVDEQRRIVEVCARAERAKAALDRQLASAPISRKAD